MPVLLKRDVCRLLEASIENLSLGLLGLGVPRRLSSRDIATETAGVIGLIGSAIELAMSACVVQVYGMKGLLVETNNRFKTGSQILDDFRRLLREPIPKANFLTQGVSESKAHLDNLYSQTLKFRTLIASRAGGLHAGYGPSRDVCLTLAKDVINFLSTLSESTRIKPYLQYLPMVSEVVKERTLIIEELARKFTGEPTNSIEKSRLLSSLYLVLPDIPSETPDWIDAFERITVAPGEEDICFLLNVLQKSSVAELFKVTPSTIPENDTPIPVIVRPEDKSALPIAPHLLKREFTRMVDQWNGDIALANGRLASGCIDLPPSDVIYDLFTLKLENTAILRDRSFITAHEAWPFIASSLSVMGTPGPCWFLVRKTEDLGQLSSLLKRVSKYATSYLLRRIPDILTGIQAIIDHKPMTGIKAASFTNILNHYEGSLQKREELAEALKRSIDTNRVLPDDIRDMVGLAARGDLAVGVVLLKLTQECTDSISENAMKYWSRMLCEAATEEEDLPGILTVLRSPDLSAAHTAAKKAMMSLDFLYNGPPIE